MGKNEPEYIEGTWTAPVKDVKDFFNTEGGTVPRLENSNTNVGYVYNNANGTQTTDKAVGAVGFAYPDCDVTGLTKLSLSVARKAKDGEQKVSIRLDSKDGKEIASGIITATSYAPLDMEVTLPENTTGKHNLYAVFTSVGTTTDKYMANVKDLTGYYTYKNPNYEGSTTVKRGDVNGDGDRSIEDAVLLKKRLAKMNVNIDEKAADVDGNKLVEVIDAVLLLKHLAKMIDIDVVYAN